MVAVAAESVDGRGASEELRTMSADGRDNELLEPSLGKVTISDIYRGRVFHVLTVRVDM